MQTLLITNDTDSWKFTHQFTTIVNALDYISDESYPKQEYKEKSIRIINLCESYEYQSLGYYVSLLAQARGHKVLPTPLTIEDINNPMLSAVVTQSIYEDIQKALKHIRADNFVLSVYFGHNVAKIYDSLCSKLHGLLPIPMFQVFFKFNKDWYIKRIVPLTFKAVQPAHLPFLVQATREYFNKKHFRKPKNIVRYYDMAILYNPNEKNPPSNKQAIEKFIKAGESMGLDVSLINRDDIKTIAQYDALFIRETTSVNHHTYRFARHAQAEGIVVVDDPNSILRCSNKVYLSELLNKNHISTPETHIISKQNYQEIAKKIKFPCVLKKPDGAFSQGVVKVDNKEEFLETVNQFLKTSELVITQVFMPTEFDWRIGIFDNQPLFACRYYMAKDHWQIYNWQSKDETLGDSKTIAIQDVPKYIIKSALNAAKLIGDGLYGVDIKEIKDKPYIIEVNDNPNIDADIEDHLLKDTLYETVMSVFIKRIRRTHGYE